VIKIPVGPWKNERQKNLFLSRLGPWT